MTKISSYTDYLPEVVWSRESDPSQFLGRFLCVFEKLWTGIPDGVVIEHGNHEHDPLEKTIDELAYIFNPWRTEPKLLPWLASWVALTLRKDWDEYQRRKLISEMVSIYQQRGLKKGLYTYLDIYAATQAKPRIAIDDGEALFRGTFTDGRIRLRAVAYSHTIELPNSSVAVLLHPSAVAVDADNNYIVADRGSAEQEPRQATLWSISKTGEFAWEDDQDSGLPKPKPIHAGEPLRNPVAVVVDRKAGDDQDRYTVLDSGPDSSPRPALFRFSPPDDQISQMIRSPDLPVVYPVDMVLDATGQLIILDRGRQPVGDPPAGRAAPKIVVVHDESLAVEEHPLNTVVEPTALAIDSRGRLIVADAKDQFDFEPADLVEVDPADEWQETPLLATVAGNPLIFPTGLAVEHPESLLVCDMGLRWGYEPNDPDGRDPNYRFMADRAVIYRVVLAQAQTEIIPVMEERRLVHPTKMALDRKGRIIITDQGEFFRGLESRRDWRAKPDEFGVVMHFSRQRPLPLAERKRIQRAVADVVEEHKPGQTFWSPVI